MRRAAAPALLVALALVAGCSGDDEPSTTPSSPTSAESSESSPTASSSSPSADVATGIVLTRPNSTVTAPEGWTKGRELVSDQAAADSPDHLAFLALSEIEAFGSTQTAEQLGHTRVESSVQPKPPELQPVAELDGVPVYHVAGDIGGGQYIEEFGAIRNDRIVSLTFSFNQQVPVAERKDVIAQVLPTFAWR